MAGEDDSVSRTENCSSKCVFTVNYEDRLSLSLCTNHVVMITMMYVVPSPKTMISQQHDWSVETMA